MPVQGEAFYDRERELARLVEAGEQLRWLAVLGPRKIGKTSLLLEAARRLAERPAVALIDVFEDLPVSVRFFRRYALRVADTLLGRGLELHEHAPEAYRTALAAKEAFAALPADLRTDLLSLPEAADERLLRLSLDLPERLAAALDRRLLVAIDEFQELASIRRGRHPDPLPLMRATWQRHQRVGYVISGSERTTLLGMITDRRAPFFQHFDVVELGPLPRVDAMALLTDGGLDEAEAEVLYGLFGGHPFYLQVLGDEVLREGDRGPAALKAAVQRVLFSRAGRLALYFEGEYTRLVGKAATVAATLLAVARSPARVTDVAAAIGASTGSAARYLERLGDAVTKGDGDRYRVTDPVFALWLRWRQPGGTVVPMTVLGDDAEREVADRLARQGFELVYQSRGSRGAFDLLATRGPHQLGVQVKRSALPLRFTEDAWARMETDAARWGWTWLVAAVEPKTGKVTFLDPAGARRGREVRLATDAAVPAVTAWLDRAAIAPRGNR